MSKRRRKITRKDKGKAMPLAQVLAALVRILARHGLAKIAGGLVKVAQSLKGKGSAN